MDDDDEEEEEEHLREVSNPTSLLPDTPRTISWNGIIVPDDEEDVVKSTTA